MAVLTAESVSNFKNKILCFLRREKDEFKKMTKAEKRVAIAKDVLAQIKCENYVPRSGVYVDINPTRKAMDKGLYIDSLSQRPADLMLEEGLVTCTVCAKGAMFMSHIRKDSDTCSVSDAKEGDSEDNIEERLTDIFDEKQLDMIEAAFESDGAFYADNHVGNFEKEDWDGNITYIGKAGKAERFGEKYSDDQRRLVGIMKNIIKNEGTFKL